MISEPRFSATAAAPVSKGTASTGKPRKAPQTGKNPFKISINRVATPAPRPTDRNTLVAPTLPDPTVRMSMPLRARPIRYPVGRDPAANPTKTHSPSFMISPA